MRLRFSFLPLSVLAARSLFAQVAPPIMVPSEPPVQQPAQSQPQPARPQGPGAPALSTQPAEPGKPLEPGLFQLDNTSLTDMVNVLAKRLKINIIVDPKVNGAVTIHTYGEVKPVDLMPLLETVLRVNHASLVKVGDLYHVVPVNSISQLPIDPLVNADGKTLPDDERMILDLIFLKYTTATEIEKLIKPFLGEGASDSVYEPANLIIIQDNSRNMRRTLDLLAMFDSDTFAGQRVKLFEVENSRPSDLVKDLDSVFKAYALSEKASAVKFIPIDRINTLIAVAPNPGIFDEVQKWIDKLDVAPKIPVGATGMWVYRLKYGRAETMAMAIMALYSGNPMALIQMARQMNQERMSQGMGFQGGGGYGGGGYGGGGYGGGGYGGGGYGGGGYGGGGYGGGGYGGNTFGSNYSSNSGFQTYAPGTTPPGSSASSISPFADQTGQYLRPTGQGTTNPNAPHVIPNPFDNTILVQGSSQDWEQIRRVLDQLDVSPRQVLIDAKIYEVDLSDTLNLGLTTTLNNPLQTGNQLNGSSASSALTLTAGWLVSRTRLLQAQLSASETRGTTKLVSAPSVIATDSIPATMNIGTQIPVASSNVRQYHHLRRNLGADRKHQQPEQRCHAEHPGAGEFERRGDLGNRPAGELAGNHHHLEHRFALLHQPFGKHPGYGAGWRYHCRRRRNHGKLPGEQRWNPFPEPHSGDWVSVRHQEREQIAIGTDHLLYSASDLRHQPGCGRRRGDQEESQTCG